MAKQQRLEQEAIPHREELLLKNDYQAGALEYNESHKDALSDGDPLGKGTGEAMGVAPLPGSVLDKGISRRNVNTSNGGGQYDIEGRPEVGKSGRVELMAMNLYSEHDSYGVDSVDTSANRAKGQYYIKD
jgi:hypothetical protein